MKEIKAVVRTHKLDHVLSALHRIGNLPSVISSETRVTNVVPAFYDAGTMTKIEVMVPDALADQVVSAIQEAAHTGHEGDGRIYVIPIEDSVVSRTGERGEDAR